MIIIKRSNAVFLNFTLFGWLILILSSCENEKQDMLREDYLNSFVDIDGAKKMAGQFKNNLLGKDLLKKRNSAKTINNTIKSILEVPDDNKKTAFYVINYENGGFLILSADKRVDPVLAFSEENNFDVNSETFPTGLVTWLYDTKESIQRKRLKNEELTEEMRKRWEELLLIKPMGKKTKRVPIEEPDCTSYTIIKGPYLKTKWGQGCGYNSELSVLDCDVPCGRAYTGCVATSMAQIMRYHQYPNSFSWGSMANDYGNYSTAILMKDIGQKVGMNYKCDGSGADTKDKVANALKSSYGYSSATYAEYDYQVVKNEMDQGRPVILRGGRDTGWWIFGQYSEGHAWVCDGYMRYVDPCWGSMLHFHMNWGWDNKYNGYFAFNNFNPGDNTFNYKTGMVYNIKP